MGMSDNAKWLILAVASSVFIGMSFILKKKGLKQAGSTGTRAAQDLQGSMSTQGASTSSPSSSSTPRRTYEVFLSFRGEDTRKNFTDHLYKALIRKGIFTFRDDENLERGRSISQELVKAIEESKFAIVILSINYAFSTWCLDELVHIVRCMEETGLEVVPIFYHVNPSDVRKQAGTFAKAFDEHEKRALDENEMETWRKALRVVANVSGWDSKDRYESEFIQEIVEEIHKKLNSKFLIIHKNLVGVESMVAELIPLFLDFGNNVCMIGICGMGGIGKTTLARVVYDMYSNSNKFDASSFIANVREKSAGKDGLLQLQKQLLKDILGEINIDITDDCQGVNIIKNRLCQKKVLLALDDVNHVNQLKNLAGERHWFGSGSWIIITTREEHVLAEHGVLKIYKPNVLNNDDALQLFCSKAFKNEQPKEGYMQLSQEFVEYAGGLPLALVTLGSFLVRRTIDDWQSALDHFKKNPPKEIFDILKISFDGLEDMWKEVFLDIACFFTGWFKFKVIRILENCGFEARIIISVLQEKSLLTVIGKELWMHDLLQEMGEKIVRQQSFGGLGGQSRLWLIEDLFHVLENNMATNAIQAIVIRNGEADSNFEERPEDFSKMFNLRLLIIDGLNIPNALNHVPNGLRHLSWKYCPLKRLPSSFQPKELVELDLQHSKCEDLWEGAKCLGKLKSIHLSYSKNLIWTPDFSEATGLEVLGLYGCTNLVGLHPSIEQLSKLKSLNLPYCKSLTNLPSFSEATGLEVLDLNGCTNLVGLHPSIGQLSKLKSLILHYCESLTNLPSFSEATGLEELNLVGCTNLVGLHPSIGQLSKLKSLNLCGCKSLTNLPSLSAKMESLTSIFLSKCSKIEKFPEFKGTMKSLSQITWDWPAIEEIPCSSIECLTALESLDLIGCKDLECLPSNMDSLRSLKFFSLSGCSKLANLPENLWKIKCLETLVLDGISQLEEIELNGIGCLSSLKYLSLSWNNVVTLPAIFSQLSKLETLYLCGCKKLRSVPELPSTMRYINMVGCCSLEPSPGLLRQSSLPRPYSSPFFRGYDESSGGVAFTILKRYLQGLLCEKTGYETATKRKEDGSKTEFQIFIPGCLVPRWLTHQSGKNSISVVLPPNWCNSRWMGFTLCALFNEEANIDGEYRACVKAIGDMPDSQYVFENLEFGGCRCSKNNVWLLDLFRHDWFCTVGNSECRQIENHVWLLYLPRDDWFSTVGNGECRQIEVVFEDDDCFSIRANFVKRCGVSLVYEQDLEQMEELNQANAQCCSSSRVITFEGWDGVHHGYFN